jgi:hypothetical protein
MNGGTVEDAANILGDSPVVIRKHYLPWCKQFQHAVPTFWIKSTVWGGHVTGT